MDASGIQRLFEKVREAYCVPVDVIYSKDVTSTTKVSNENSVTTEDAGTYVVEVVFKVVYTLGTYQDVVSSIGVYEEVVDNEVWVMVDVEISGSGNTKVVNE